jgi:hypothetical protein
MEKQIKNFENYTINFNAEIVNTKTGKRLKPHKDDYGYLNVTLTNILKVKKTFRVHKLMAITFLDHNPCGMERVINHIDNNKLNNNINNLEEVTPRYNSTCHREKGGYNFQKGINKWRAQIYYNDRNYHLGLYPTTEQCKMAYQKGLEIINKKLSNQETIELLKGIKKNNI